MDRNDYLWLSNQHLRRQLGKQIIHLPNTENDPWIVISDLNELSNPIEKVSTNKGI